MFILSLGVTSPGISPVTWLSLLARGLGIAFVSSLGISVPLITPVILSMGAWHFCLVFLGLTYPLITHLLPQLRFFLYILVTSEIYFLYLIITEFIIIITIIIIIIIIIIVAVVVVVAIVIIITLLGRFLFREASIDYKNYY